MADTVLIGCKHPNGLVLNLDRYQRTEAKGPGIGIRRIDGARFTLRGYSMPVDPVGMQSRMKSLQRAGVAIEGGYALTPVPVDFWEEWWKENGQISPLVKDGIILPPHADAVRQAEDHVAVEPMFRQVPADGKDPRAPGVERDLTEQNAA